MDHFRDLTGRRRSANRAAADGHEVASITNAFNFVVVSFRVSAELQDRSAHSVLAFFIAWATVICCSLPALARPRTVLVRGSRRSDLVQNSKTPIITVKILPARRGASTRGSRTYPQERPAKRTERAWLLRGNWKTDLNNGWRLGLLAQVPVVNKTIFDPNGSVQEFGIGDTAFQAALIHAINRHWAFGFGARLVVPTAETGWEAANGRSCQGLGYAIPSLTSGPTLTSCLLFGTRSALPAILRDGISVNRRLRQHSTLVCRIIGS